MAVPAFDRSYTKQTLPENGLRQVYIYSTLAAVLKEKAAMNSLQQTLEIILTAVEPVTIHGSPYYEISYQIPGSETPRQIRINPEAFYPNPKPGDRVSVNVLMGNIMGAQRLD
jgi:hypothetical protein